MHKIYCLLLGWALSFAVMAHDNKPQQAKLDEMQESIMAHDNDSQQAKLNELQEPMFKPLIERYILDELKTMRMELQTQRAEFAEKLAQARLDAADRAIGYTTSTVNNVFFVITAAASILALVGWNSLRDIKARMEDVVEKKIADINLGYEERLSVLEQRLRERSEQIIAAHEQIIVAHEQIARTNTIHSLWMRAGLESTPQAKIEVYDEILHINPEDVEALTYKADAALEQGEPQWALTLCNNALELKPDYAYAHYQRACAYSTLNHQEHAIQDLRQALKLSQTYLEEARVDKSLENLRASGKLDELFASLVG